MFDRYRDRVRLLLRVLPDVAGEDVFALKGGTGINLFCRDMPRLSVDIDLTYLPVDGRETDLRGIDAALNRIMATITKRTPQLRARRTAGGGDSDTRIMVSHGQVRIKIETSPVSRGTVCRPAMRTTSAVVTEQFGFAEVKVVAFEDL